MHTICFMHLLTKQSHHKVHLVAILEFLIVLELAQQVQFASRYHWIQVASVSRCFMCTLGDCLIRAGNESLYLTVSSKCSLKPLSPHNLITAGQVHLGETTAWCRRISDQIKSRGDIILSVTWNHITPYSVMPAPNCFTSCCRQTSLVKKRKQKTSFWKLFHF